MGLNHLLLALFWILFCVFHSLFANPSVKEYFGKAMGEGFVFYRPVYIVFSFASLTAVILFQVNMTDVELFLLTDFLFVTGLVICFSGLVVMVTCIQKYFISISGLRNLISREETGTLMITGIHRFVRHPLYLGTFVFIWGLFMLIPYAGLLISNMIITLYTLIGIKLEEEKLLHQYGDQYRLYRKEVPMLLPSFRHR